MKDLVPSIHWPDRNTKALKIDLCGMCLFFSYSTLVGVLVPKQGAWRCEEKFSRTTNHHLRDFGIDYWPRLPQCQLETKARDGAVQYFQDQLREKFL